MKRKAKKRAGRPALGRVKFTTTLPERTVELLRKIGNGNASGAIVALVEDEVRRHPLWLETE